MLAELKAQAQARAELKTQACEIAHHFERPGLAKIVDVIEPQALRSTVVRACDGGQFDRARLSNRSYAAGAFGVLLSLARGK